MTRNVTVFPDGQRLIEGTEAMHQMMASFVSLAAEAANADAASLYAVDAKNRVLVPYVTVNLPESYVTECGAVAVGDQCCGRAVLNRQQWIVSDMLIDPLFASAKKAAERSPIRAAFSTPVVDSTGYCMASLACHFFERHIPSTADLTRNKLWAQLIAHTVEDCRQSSIAVGA